MPRDKVAIKAPVPWNQAVAWAGSEHRLTKGVKDGTWQWWKSKRMVPADRAMPFAVERIARLEKALASSGIPDPAPPDPLENDPDYVAARGDLQIIFTRGQDTAALTGIIENLSVFAYALQHGYTSSKGGPPPTPPLPIPTDLTPMEAAPAPDQLPPRPRRRRRAS